MAKQIRLRIAGEHFWAFRYPDLPPNQAEINNHLLNNKYSFGDRVEFDEEGNVVRLVKTRAQVAEENSTATPVSGHKTIRDGSGCLRHEPMSASGVNAIRHEVAAKAQRRAELMPDEQAAISMMFDTHTRLKELGFRDAVYCPKDGTYFDAILPGSTGIHRCHYSGEWPDGSWWVSDGGDVWPAYPCLYRNRP